MIRFVFALALLPSVAAADIPRVAGDIAPVRSLVARVMEGVGAPAAILPQGASPHSHSMRPSEARALISADLVVWIGAGLTPFLSDPIETLASDAQVLTLLDLPGTVRREVGPGHAHDHGHDHGDDHDHDHDRGREREGSGNDPHAWLDPGNAAVWLDAIADRLAALDPDNAATYRANAAAGRAEIAAAAAELATLLAPFGERPFVVGHDAYAHFQAAFDLSTPLAIQMTDAAPAGPSHLSDLRARVGDLCVFVEPESDPDAVANMLDIAPDRIVVIDPLGTALPEGPGLYVTLLTALGTAMADCLSTTS